MSADFQAQMTLFDQSVINFLELSQTPEKCDEYITKLSIQLEEMETKFIDFDEFIQKIGEKEKKHTVIFKTKEFSLRNRVIRERRICMIQQKGFCSL